MGELEQALESVLAVHDCTDALAELRSKLPASGSGSSLTLDAVLNGFARAQRAFGPERPALSAAERARLQTAGVVEPGVFSCADLARVLWLRLALAAMPAGEHTLVLTRGFRTGDNNERVALLRALPLLAEPARFTELAIEACRTHVLDVFAAIACDNPFPARHFPEPNFNQLVIKSLFLELPLERIHDWRGRANAELVRMASDYEAERRAAGRTVPADIALIRATESSS
jgi:hypothetical protein